MRESKTRERRESNDRFKDLTEKKPSQNSSGRIKAQRLTGKATREFNERMGLSNSALVISNKLKTTPKAD